MNILFTICGRAGSKGIKNKNIKDFLGVPLPLYTLSAIDLYLKKHPEANGEVAVDTDSRELMRIMRENTLGREVVFVERSEALSGDSVPKIAVIRECMYEIRRRRQISYDMVIDLDITSPLRTVEDLEKLIAEKNTGLWQIVFTVTDSRRNPYFNMVKCGKNGYERVIASDFHTRQEAPEIYDMNASMYAYAPEFLETGKNIFEAACGIVKMKDTGILDLDHENDFELMQVIAQYLFEKDNAFGEIRKNLALNR